MSRLVLISTTCMCINTFPWMQTTDINGESIDNPNLAMIEVTQDRIRTDNLKIAIY